MDGSIAPEARNDLYEADEHAWLLRQIAALQAGHPHELDAPNLVEFLESMARRDVRELRSRLARLLQHMLKFTVQPGRASRSWAKTVLHQQAELRDIVEQASLRQEALHRLESAYELARRYAAIETGLPATAFPANNPWTLDEALHWTPPERAE